MLHCFVVNPVAGRVDIKFCEELIKKICTLRNVKYEIKISEKAGDIAQLSGEAAQKGADYIYAIGGDGTLNEAVNGIVGAVSSAEVVDGATVSMPVLVPVPCGTGNDFVRAIDSGDVYSKYVKRINSAKKGSDEYKDALCGLIESAVDNCSNVKLMDMGFADGRYFINVASVGFDAEVAYNACKYKKKRFIPNSLAYYVSVFTTLIKYRPKFVEIVYDDVCFVNTEVTLVAVANGRFYGGGVMAAPNADLFDRLFDVLTVDPVKRRQIPSFFPKYAKGKHEKLPIAHFKRCSKVKISCKDGIALNLDGEITVTNNVVFNMCDRQIPVGIVK